MRIGCVKYLNARPLIHGWRDPVTLDHPSALCRLLAAGELDIALVSSFEFLRHPIYRIVDNVSIASDGPVYSVVVAYRDQPLFSDVELDPASQTSVALLSYLMAERGKEFRSWEITGDLLGPINEDRGRLLIGDQAIRFRQKFGDAYQYWDLGAEWKRCAGVPFVYALWLVRPGVAGDSTLGRDLRALRDANLQNIGAVIAAQSEFDPAFCRRYYGQNLRFSLGDREKEGLLKFANICAKLNLIQKGDLKLELI
ncbi:MAG TPA: menaquinone biosynthesis protein [Chthoniobacterales bacterium]|nr:menaquinone biosynthesis protein [Chthoniobacterales bacterium]